MYANRRKEIHVPTVGASTPTMMQIRPARWEKSDWKGSRSQLMERFLEMLTKTVVLICCRQVPQMDDHHRLIVGSQ